MAVKELKLGRISAAAERALKEVLGQSEALRTTMSFGLTREEALAMGLDLG